jgi:dihydroorotase-like cyclic amidohydrolase
MLSVLLVVATDAGSQPCDSSPLIVRNVRVWTSTGLLTPRDVLLQNGRVASVQPAGGSVAKGFRTIDGTGHTLLPGLVDAHLHFTVPGGLPRTDGPPTQR